MGSVVKAVCPCGYHAAFTIGGSMSSFKKYSYFPLRCDTCGIVEVNIASKRLRCPNDAKHKLTRIGGTFQARMARCGNPSGEAAIRKPSFWERLGFRRAGKAQSAEAKPAVPISPGPELRVVCQCGDYEIYNEPYQCPDCGQLTLQFKRSLIRFD